MGAVLKKLNYDNIFRKVRTMDTKDARTLNGCGQKEEAQLQTSLGKELENLRNTINETGDIISHLESRLGNYMRNEETAKEPLKPEECRGGSSNIVAEIYVLSTAVLGGKKRLINILDRLDI
jgi:hypothetical protein